MAAHAEREEVLLQRVLPITKTIETFRLDVSETRAALQDALTSEYELAQMQLSWRRDNVRTARSAGCLTSLCGLIARWRSRRTSRRGRTRTCCRR